MIAQWWTRLKGHKVARNAFWVFLSILSKLPLQAAYFVVIARMLGSHDFGKFSSVCAMVGIAAPFASFGTGLLLIKNVSRDRASYASSMGKALVTMTLLSLIITAMLLLAAPLILPAGVGLVLLLAVSISDLYFLNLHVLAGNAFTSVESLNFLGIHGFLQSASKLLAAAIFARYFTGYGIDAWAILYLLGTAVPALLFYLNLHVIMGPPALSARMESAEWREGFHFAMAASAQSFNNDADKALLASLSSPIAAGVYSAAYRFMTVALLPVKSFLWATLARFFKHGAQGPAASQHYAWKLMPLPAIYGVAVSIVMWLGAPLVPLILGSDYSESAQALRWLAPLPIFKILLEFPANALSSSGAQALRSWIQVLIVAVNFLLLFWLIPIYSWKGAAWASIASDALQLILLWVSLAWWCRQSNAVAVDGAAP